MKINLIIIGIFILSGGFAQNRKIYPTEKPVTDKSLITFIEQLKAAVKAKSKASLLSMLADDVVIGYDGENSKRAFEAIWFEPDPQGDIWAELDKTIARKGDYLIADYTTNTYSNEDYIFPYVLNFDFSGMDDIFEYGAITGTDVNLRSEPSTSSTVVTKLSYDVVKFVYENNQQMTSGTISGGMPEWYKVQTEDKKYTGWVYYKFFYSPLDYKLYLRKYPNGWKISAFAVGD